MNAAAHQLHGNRIFSGQCCLVSGQQTLTFSYKHGFPAASGRKGLAVICSELTIRPESTDGKKLASNSFQHSSPHRRVLPDDEKDESGSGWYRSCCPITTISHMLMDASCLLYLFTSDSVSSRSKCLVTKQLSSWPTGSAEGATRSQRSTAALLLQPLVHLLRVEHTVLVSTQHTENSFSAASYPTVTTSKQINKKTASEVKCFAYFLNKLTIFEKHSYKGAWLKQRSSQCGFSDWQCVCGNLMSLGCDPQFYTRNKRNT